MKGSFYVGENQFGFMSLFYALSFPFNSRNNVLFVLSTLFYASSYRSLAAQMPAKYRKNKVKPRGVSNRNRGLEWIRANATDGVLYFADDDNTYDLDIFDEVRILFNNRIIASTVRIFQTNEREHH